MWRNPTLTHGSGGDWPQDYPRQPWTPRVSSYGIPGGSKFRVSEKWMWRNSTLTHGSGGDWPQDYPHQPWTPMVSSYGIAGGSKFRVSEKWMSQNSTLTPDPWKWWALTTGLPMSTLDPGPLDPLGPPEFRLMGSRGFKVQGLVSSECGGTQPWPMEVVGIDHRTTHVNSGPPGFRLMGSPGVQSSVFVKVNGVKFNPNPWKWCGLTTKLFMSTLEFPWDPWSPCSPRVSSYGILEVQNTGFMRSECHGFQPWFMEVVGMDHRTTYV